LFVRNLVKAEYKLDAFSGGPERVGRSASSAQLDTFWALFASPRRRLGRHAAGSIRDWSDDAAALAALGPGREWLTWEYSHDAPEELERDFASADIAAVNGLLAQLSDEDV
jgi:hypothetical protein